MPENFTFEISLSVLNHLGRNLYRSFTTVLGEAISNAWDADAENVHIFLDRENGNFVIKDDGVGMTAKDFQEKFLKIGYSKRKDGVSQSTKGRPFIGRKGIGKLALLSCADTVTVISKVSGGNYIGGVIDNSGLDQAITEDLKPEKYPLGNWEKETFSEYTDGHEHGTIIGFENIKGGIKNSVDFLRKITALYFRFSLLDEAFNIHINNKKITIDDLDDLAQRTEFLWNINNLSEPYLEQKLIHLIKEPAVFIQMDENIRGFVASVERPRDLNIRTTNERASVDLFVNGRLREKNILKHVQIAKIAENYFYGQIHFDDLDDSEDRFTSSREGIIADDPKYGEFLADLRKKMLEIVVNWDKLRRKHRKDGDPENENIPPKERKAEELYNAVLGEYDLPKESKNRKKVNDWMDSLTKDATYNLASYAQCFISENLLRKSIQESGSTPTSCTNVAPCGKTCIDRYDTKTGNTSFCEYCKGERGKQVLQQQKDEARISIPIRSDEDNILMYLDYIDLTKIIENDILMGEDKTYKPLRNSVMHTSRLTPEAKTKLTSVFDNIVATIKRFFGEA